MATRTKYVRFKDEDETYHPLILKFSAVLNAFTLFFRYTRKIIMYTDNYAYCY